MTTVTQPSTKQEKRRPNDVRKISDTTVARIRELWGTGKYTQPQLANMFQLTQGYISQLVTRKARVLKQTYKREISLLDKRQRTYVYGETGEQIGILETDDAKQARIETLITERRELEKRIREINNEIAALEGIPF
jgi:hypothetical protein